ncbi:MAG: hypothetical protein AAF989_05930, partial [Planctomycetota bacterium]
MKFTIKKRFVLVGLIALGQAVCLLAATLVFSKKMRSAIRQTIHDQVLADNVQTARQMTTLIHQLDVEDLRENIDSWHRIQRTIRDIRLPNEGFVCLTDSKDGSVLCHPALGDRPDHLPLLTSSPSADPGTSKPGMVESSVETPVM